MLPVAGFIGLLGFAYSFWAIIDLRLTKKSDVRLFWKPVWWAALLFFGPLGALAWTLIGRPKGVGFVPGGDLERLRTIPKDTEQVSSDESETTKDAPIEATSYPAAPLGPEDSPEWATFVANSQAAIESDIDLSEWEAEFDEPYENL